MNGRLFTEIIHRDERVDRLAPSFKLHYYFARSSTESMRMDFFSKQGTPVAVTLHSVRRSDE